MKMVIKSVEPGLKRLQAPGPGQTLIGYLRRDPDGVWVGIDHGRGLTVVRTDKGFRLAVKLMRAYFDPLHPCGNGCGRLTVNPLCGNCTADLLSGAGQLVSEEAQ